MLSFGLKILWPFFFIYGASACAVIETIFCEDALSLVKASLADLLVSTKSKNKPSCIAKFGGWIP